MPPVWLLIHHAFPAVFSVRVIQRQLKPIGEGVRVPQLLHHSCSFTVRAGAEARGFRLFEIGHSYRLPNHSLPGTQHLAHTFLHRGHVACHQVVKLALDDLALPELTLHKLMLHCLPSFKLFLLASSQRWLLLNRRFAQLDSVVRRLLELHLALAHDAQETVLEASLYFLQALTLLREEYKSLR